MTKLRWAVKVEGNILPTNDKLLAMIETWRQGPRWATSA